MGPDHDELDNHAYTSPDNTVRASWAPELDARGPLWTVTHTPGGGYAPSAWQATFSDDTPAELIAAFLTDLVRTEPLDTGRAESYPRRISAE